MPVAPTYPGVYIEEVPSGVRTIVGVATSKTAFVGASQRGPSNDPLEVNNFGEYEKNFGPIQASSLMGYAVRQFFQNGGTEAIIVRVANEDAQFAKVSAGGLPLIASGQGVWGNAIRVRIDHVTKDMGREDPPPSLFNITLQYRDEDAEVEIRETFRNVSTSRDDPRYIKDIRQVSILSQLCRNPEIIGSVLQCLFPLQLYFLGIDIER